MGLAGNISRAFAKYFDRERKESGQDLKRGEDYTRAPLTGPDSQGYHRLNDELTLDGDLMSRYADYENIADYGEAAAALDIYADDATTKDLTENAAIWVKSKDVVIKAILEDLLTKRLKVDESIWSVTRVLCMYGNVFGEVLANNEGVLGINFMPTPSVRRVESRTGELIGFVQDITGQFNITNREVGEAVHRMRHGESQAAVPPASGYSRAYGHMQASAGLNPRENDVTIFQPWEVIHWRLQARHVSAPYGQSVLEPARYIFPRLAMFEDSALIYRLTRSPARFAYYVDVGELPQGQSMAYVEAVKRKYKKQQSWNPSRGILGLRNNPMGMNEDLWLPMRGGQESTRVDVLAGPDYQVVDDLEYFRDKFFSAIRVPRAYLGFDIEASRNALSNVDVRFAKATMRVQQQLIAGYSEACRMHLAILGVDPDLADWELEMKLPSHIFELAQIELMGAKLDVAEKLKDWLPKTWILERVLGFSAEESDVLQRSKVAETEQSELRAASVQQTIGERYPLAVGMDNSDGAPPQPDQAQESLREAVMTGLSRLEKRLDEQGGTMALKLDSLSKPIKHVNRALKLREHSDRTKRAV